MPSRVYSQHTKYSVPNWQSIAALSQEVACTGVQPAWGKQRVRPNTDRSRVVVVCLCKASWTKKQRTQIGHWRCLTIARPAHHLCDKYHLWIHRTFDRFGENRVSVTVTMFRSRIVFALSLGTCSLCDRSADGVALPLELRGVLMEPPPPRGLALACTSGSARHAQGVKRIESLSRSTLSRRVNPSGARRTCSLHYLSLPRTIAQRARQYAPPLRSFHLIYYTLNYMNNEQLFGNASYGRGLHYELWASSLGEQQTARVWQSAIRRDAIAWPTHICHEVHAKARL